MTVSNCPEHRDLMRELARGCFDDERSLRAETVREECADCARWWNETLSGEAYDAVDGAVAEAISSFVPPARRRYRWLAAAAALVLAVGVATTSILWRGAQGSNSPPSDQVSGWDFENHTVAATVEKDVSHDEAGVFAGGFESGDLSGWSTGS